jgi:hypothetical protein
LKEEETDMGGGFILGVEIKKEYLCFENIGMYQKLE